MLLKLPFLYTVALKRGTQRRARDYTVRGYTLVEIPEICAGDLTEVLVCEADLFDYETQERKAARVRYLAREEVLMRPLIHKDAPVSGPELEETVGGERTDPRIYQSLLGWFRLPTPGMRHAGYDELLNPMRWPTLGALIESMDGEAHPVERSDFPGREADAQIHLSRSIAVVDGGVLVEVPEPVWELDRWNKLSFAHPETEDAVRSFRLDRFDAPDNPYDTRKIKITIARPDLLLRDDVVELTRCAIAHWPKWRMRALSAGGKIAGPRGLFELVDEIARKDKVPTAEECITVLETYCLSRTLLKARGQRFWDRGYSVPDRAGAIASRWRKERDGFRDRHPGLMERHEAYVSQYGGLELSEADIDALADIY